ncbi:MAG: chemotaxis protein CheW [Nitrospirae bacterium]|nr:chemotaxis protein CheW [Nitrospirota bacterium]
MKDSCKLVVFSLDRYRYALSLGTVRRIVRMVEITPLPKAPEIVTGVIDSQGEIIPVVNVRKRFRLPERGIRPEDLLIIATTSRRTVALIADEAAGVIESPEQEIVEAGEVLPSMEYVKGLLKLKDGIVLIHDLGEFLSLDEEEALGEAMNEARAQ